MRLVSAYRWEMHLVVSRPVPWYAGGMSHTAPPPAPVPFRGCDKSLIACVIAAAVLVFVLLS